MNRIRTATTVTALAAALLAPALAATPALAQGGRPGVSASGACSSAGTWELKAKTDDPALIEVEFEVDTDVVGQTFSVRVTDGSTVVFSGRRTTVGRSGSFTVGRTTADRAGRDTIRATATNGANVCSGVVRL